LEIEGFGRSKRQDFIGIEVKKQSRGFCIELSRMLNGLMKSLKNKETANS
jgi:hypothetical protein